MALFINKNSLYELVLICTKDSSKVSILHTHDRDGVCRLETNDDPELVKFSPVALQQFSLVKGSCVKSERTLQDVANSGSIPGGEAPQLDNVLR